MKLAKLAAWMFLAAAPTAFGCAVDADEPNEGPAAVSAAVEEPVTSAAAVEEENSGDVGSAVEEPGVGVAEEAMATGFGCPFRRYECHNHCRSIGRRGGYCAGGLRLTCTCYRR